MGKTNAFCEENNRTIEIGADDERNAYENTAFHVKEMVQGYSKRSPECVSTNLTIDQEVEYAEKAVMTRASGECSGDVAPVVYLHEFATKLNECKKYEQFYKENLNCIDGLGDFSRLTSIVVKDSDELQLRTLLGDLKLSVEHHVKLKLAKMLIFMFLHTQIFKTIAVHNPLDWRRKFEQVKSSLKKTMKDALLQSDKQVDGQWRINGETMKNIANPLIQRLEGPLYVIITRQGGKAYAEKLADNLTTGANVPAIVQLIDSKIKNQLKYDDLVIFIVLNESTSSVKNYTETINNLAAQCTITPLMVYVQRSKLMQEQLELSSSVVIHSPDIDGDLRTFAVELKISCDGLLDKHLRTNLAAKTDDMLEMKLQLQKYKFASIDFWKDAIAELTDTASKPRQMLVHKYKARNVRVIEASSDEIILEIIPHNPQGLKTLIEDNHNKAKTLDETLKSNLGDWSKSCSIIVTCDSKRASELHKRLKENNTKRQLCKYFSVDGPASSKQKQDVRQSKEKVVAGVAKTIIEDKRSYLYDFIIKILRTDVNWKSVKNELGQNILHMCVISSRHDLLPAIFYAGAWDDLRSELARADQNEADDVLYTPFALAEKYHSRSNGMATLDEMRRLDDLWLSTPLLHKACIHGKMPYVRQLLRKNNTLDSIDINVQDDAGNTPILYASAAGYNDIVDYLLKHGADPNISNDVGDNALIRAVYGYSDIVRMLLKAGMNDVEYRDINGLRAIDHAVMNGDIEMVDTLNENGIFPDDVSVTFAAKYGRLLILEHLLGKYKLSINGKDSEGRTPLLNAVALGSTKMVDMLLSNGACLSSSDNRKRNVLHIAALNNHVDVTKLLISKIHDDLKIDEEIPSLQYLLNAQDFHSGKEEGMVVRGRDRGRPAWHYIQLWRTRKTIFNACLTKGQVDVKLYSTVMGSGFGSGPSKEFMTARRNEFTERQKEFIADLTPLAIAVLNDHYDLATLFLDLGADANIHDNVRSTPLHYASMTGNLDLIKALIQKGANLDIKNDENLLPADVAQINGHTHVENFLKGHSYLKLVTVIREFIEKAKVEIDIARLNDIRNKGENVRYHLINTLRDIQIDINQSLVDLGSGPVEEASSGNDFKLESSTFAGTRDTAAPIRPEVIHNVGR